MPLVPLVTVCEVAGIVLCDVPLVCKGVDCLVPLVPLVAPGVIPEVTD